MEKTSRDPSTRPADVERVPELDTMTPNALAKELTEAVVGFGDASERRYGPDPASGDFNAARYRVTAACLEVHRRAERLAWLEGEVRRLAEVVS